MKAFRLYVLFLCISSPNVYAQKVATLEVELTGPTLGLIVPVKVDLAWITSLKGDQLSLTQIRDGKSIPAAFQIISEEGTRYLHWIVEPQGDSNNKMTYHLTKGKTSTGTESLMRAHNEEGTLTIQSNAKNLLRYQFARLDPPEGVDPAYGRSGFIHPLWSPKGQVLTRIQPPDHYHHYGIWNPWTHVLYEGDTLDFWNLNKKEATVRFSKFLNIVEGPILSEYRALHEHVVLKNPGKEKVALNEIQSVRVYQPADRDYYIADITIDMSCSDKNPFLILAYRYAGLGWRTTEKWDNKNSEVLTSENKTRKDADGSTARWCLVQGAVDDEYAGALMLSYPTNYNHPEPLRIWPENQYQRGDMFANFAPTKTKDWELLPGKVYTLRYRFVVFNGKFNKEKSEAAWQHFANPVKIAVKKH
jgi:hypothetical protein